MKIVLLADGLTVSAQPTGQDLVDLRDRGVRMVINNRPDGEEPGQMDAAHAAQIAHGLGMEYRHVPVTLPTLSADDVARFAQALREAPGPVHAHCRSGLRSATLWTLGEVQAGRLDRHEAAARMEACGYDVKAGQAWLDRNVAAPGRDPDGAA